MKSKLVLFAACCLLCAVSTAQWVETVIHLPDSIGGADDVNWVDYDSSSDAVYVAGEPASVVFDGTTHQKLARLPYPGYWVGCDRAQGKVYVCGDSTYVLDAATRRVLAAIPVGTIEEEVIPPAVICATFHKLYIVSGDSVAVVDTRSDSLLGYVATGLSYGLLFAEPEEKVYSAGFDTVVAIDCRTDSIVARIATDAVSYHPMAYSPQSRKLYCGNQSDLFVIDCRADTIAKRVHDDQGFWLLFYNARANRVYCLLAFNSVAAVDCATDSVVRTIPARAEYAGAYYSPTADKFYCLAQQDYCGVVDCARDTLYTSFHLGVTGPLPVCCDNPGNGEVYCCSRDGGTVDVIDGIGDSVEATVVVGANYGLTSLRYNAFSNKVYGLDTHVGCLSVISAGTSTLERTVPVATSPLGLVENGSAQKLYTMEEGSREVVVISATSDTTVARVAYWPSLGDPLCMVPLVDKLYCGSSMNAQVHVIDCRVDSLSAVIPVPAGPSMLESHPTLPRVYAFGDYGGTQLAVLDARADSVLRTVNVRSGIGGMGFSLTEDRAYCTGDVADSMAVLDAATDSVIEYVAAPRGGSGVWNPVTDRLYYAASDQPGRSVAVFDCATNQVLRRLDAVVVGACDSIRNRVYCMDDSALLVYDGATDTLVVRVPIPTPGPFTWNPASGRVYVGSGGSDVYVIRDPTGIEEAPARTSGQRAGATVVRGVLYLQVDSRQNTGYRVDRGDCHNVDCTRGPTLLDAAGRKVMELVPGPNDVRHLASGVYFVRSEPSAVSREPSAVRKVVIQR